MGWADRRYSSRPQKGFDWKQYIFGAFRVGEVSGIVVRVHASLLWLLVFNVLFAGSRGGMGVKNAIVSSILLFGIILLHELGHCFAARAVGGDAHEILMWPLGGLAYTSPPRRPWACFFTSAGGPLVNVVICVVSGAGLLLLSGGQFVLPLNPLIPFGATYTVSPAAYLLLSGGVGYYLWWIFATSYMLLVFNLLPIFPLDGGQMLQALAWKPLGYYGSMNFACTTGMIGAAIMGLIGLATRNFLLAFIAMAGYMTCNAMKMNLRQNADAAWSDAGGVSYSSPSNYSAKSRKKKTARPRDDKFTIKSLNPFEIIAKKRRRKQLERLMRDD